MPDQLTRSPIGEFVPISGYDRRYDEHYEHVAFVPHALPDDVALSTATLTELTEAQAAIARLDGAVSDLPDPMLLVRPLIRREAVSTSALEGTYTGFGELLGAEADRVAPSGDVAEVLNYVRATEDGIAALERLPVCVRLINDAHDTLLRGVRGDSFAVGALRRTQNWIGPKDCRIHEAALVPPPHDRLPDLLASWERWIHRDDLPLIVRVALGHYQFETLHPYVDGNGRLGRLIVVLQLIEGGLMRHHLMTISGFFERDKSTYTGHLQRVRETGQFDPWVRYFSEGLRASAIDSLRRIRTAQKHSRDAVARLRDAGVRGVAIQIAEDLVGYPVMTVPNVEARYNVTYNTANTAISRLVELGVLRQVSEGTYNRVFASGPIINTFR
jgi:Fic family protein